MPNPFESLSPFDFLTPDDMYPERGVIGDIGASLGGGGLNILNIVGLATEAVDPEGGYDIARNVADRAINFVEEQNEKDFFKPSQATLNSEWRSALYHGIRSGVTSMGVGLIGATPGAIIGGPVGGALGYIGSSGTIFGLAEYGRFMRDADTAGIDKDIAHHEAVKSAFFEAGIEGASSAIELLTLRMGKPITSAFKGSIRELIKASPKEFFKSYAKVAGTEVVEEMGQEYMSTKLRQDIGIPTIAPWDAATESIGPSIVSSLLFTLGGAGINVARRAAIKNALTDPTTPQEDRVTAASIIGSKLSRNNKEMAKVWADRSLMDIRDGKAINLDLAIEDYVNKDKPAEEDIKSKIERERQLIRKRIDTTPVGEQPLTQYDEVWLKDNEYVTSNILNLLDTMKRVNVPLSSALPFDSQRIAIEREISADAKHVEDNRMSAEDIEPFTITMKPSTRILESGDIIEQPRTLSEGVNWDIMPQDKTIRRLGPISIQAGRPITTQYYKKFGRGKRKVLVPYSPDEYNQLSIYQPSMERMQAEEDAAIESESLKVMEYMPAEDIVESPLTGQLPTPKAKHKSYKTIKEKPRAKGIKTKEPIITVSDEDITLDIKEGDISKLLEFFDTDESTTHTRPLPVKEKAKIKTKAKTVPNKVPKTDSGIVPKDIERQYKDVINKVNTFGATALDASDSAVIREYQKYKYPDKPVTIHTDESQWSGIPNKPTIDDDQDDSFTLSFGVDPTLLYKTIKPFVEGSVSKLSVVMGDSSKFVRDVLRVPSRNKYTKPLSEALHLYLEREPSEVTNNSREKMRPFFSLPVDGMERVSKALWDGDENNKEWDDTDLRSTYNLSDSEVSGYRAVRDGLSYVHNEAVGLWYRKFLHRTLSNADYARMNNLKEDKFVNLDSDEIGNIKVATIEHEVEKFKKSTFLPGYMPRYRLGRYITVLTRASDNKVVHSQGFDSLKEAKDLLSLARDTGDRSRVIDTKVEFNDYKEMMAIAPFLPSIKKAMDRAGIKDAEIEHANSILTQSLLGGRLTHRNKSQYVPGFTKNTVEVLKTYTENMPRGLSKRFNADRWGKILEGMPVDMRKYGLDMVDYFHGRASREGKINRYVKTGVYAHYLMAKPAFGLLNWTQRLTMTAPWTISELDRLGKATDWADASSKGWKLIMDAQVKEQRLMGSLLAERFKGKNHKRFGQVISEATYLNQNEKYILERLYRQGELREMRQLEILEDSPAQKYMKWLDIFGFLSERSNRVHAAIVGANLYNMEGQQLIDEVDSFLNSTQIMYSKANRPVIGRGVLAPAFIFKNYMFNFLGMYANMIGRGNYAAAANGIAVIVALGGLGALPFYTEEVDMAVDLFMANVMKDINWPIRKRSYIQAIKKDKTFRALIYGAPSLVGIDSTSMVGFPSVSSVALAPMIKGLVDLPSNLMRADMTVGEKFKAVFPSMQLRRVRNLLLLMEHGGKVTDRTGKPLLTDSDINHMPMEMRELAMQVHKNTPKNMTTADMLIMILGFPSTIMNEMYEDNAAIRAAAGGVRDKKSQLNRAYAKALIDNDAGKMDEIEADSRKWGIGLNVNSIIANYLEYQEVEE